MARRVAFGPIAEDAGAGGAASEGGSAPASSSLGPPSPSLAPASSSLAPPPSSVGASDSGSRYGSPARELLVLNNRLG